MVKKFCSRDTVFCNSSSTILPGRGLPKVGCMKVMDNLAPLIMILWIIYLFMTADALDLLLEGLVCLLVLLRPSVLYPSGQAAKRRRN